MKKVLLSLTLLAASLFGKIVETYSISDFVCPIEKDHLVLINLDNTLFQARQALGHADWFYDEFQKRLDEGLSRARAIATIYPGWIKTQKSCEVIPVERPFLEQVKTWQDEGIWVMGISTRQPTIIDATEKQIKSLGIDLSRTAPVKDPMVIAAGGKTVYRNGTLYVADAAKQGEAIKGFLEESDIQPAKVVVFDDKKFNLEDLSKGVMSLGIEILPVHYRAIERVSKVYDPKLAEVQNNYFEKFGTILSNEEASLPLAAYLMNKDLFSWRAIEKQDHPDYTVHLLEMTSGQWGKKEVSDPLWKHYMRVTMPKTLRVAKSFFFIGGGKSGERVWQTPPELLSIALETGTILTELRAVPNQPLQFIGESKQRKEDQIIALTWRNFLEKKKSDYPLHFPMARAATRGVDALEDYLEAQGIKLEGVVFCGESKRAWGAWLAAAYDERVIGLIPVVCDFLNVEACFAHHYQSLGAFSPAIRDYLAEGIDEKWFGKKEFHDLMQLEDPFIYRNRHKMPKLQINASGDPFSMPDSSQFSFPHLLEPKYLCYLPNTGHYLGNSSYASIAKNFYHAIVIEKPLPQFSWKRTEDGDLSVTIEQGAKVQVKLWKTHNPEACDFRLDFTKRPWESEELKGENGVYLSPLPAMAQGWTAYFAEAHFEDGLTFTTEVFIIPPNQ